MSPARHLKAPSRAVPSVLAPLVVLAALFAFVAPGAEGGDPTCQGKPATIVSDAATITGTKAPDVIVAGPGDNVIHGAGGNDLICAGPGNDTIYGERGNDKIYGEGGDDKIYGERGSDTLDGGPGDDKIFGGRGSDQIEGGPGSDLVSGEQGNDTLDGGPGDHDIVEGNQGDDTLNGGAGDEDVIIGGPGNDKIDGGPGEHDIADYAGAGGAVTVNLQTQTVTGAEGEHLEGIEDAIGGSGNDTLIGSAETANRLDGGPGNDHLEAVGPGDEAFGGPGGDQCTGGFARETSCGPAAGADGLAVEIYESIDGRSTLILTGSPGPDQGTVNYADGKWVISGSDVTLGDPTNPDCTGGGTVTCTGTVEAIEANMGAGNDEMTIGESVPASIGATLEGGTGSDKLVGGPGNDVLYAGPDHVPDTLEGGPGNDVLYGVNIFHPKKDSGAATMNGGPGSDLMIGGQPCDGDTFDGGPGANDSASFARVHNPGITVEATIGGTVIDPDVPNCDAGHITDSTEKIEGSPGNDILTGDNGPNTLLGRGGNDKLNGMGGFDTCIGGGGHNTAVNCEKTAQIP